MMRFLRIHFFSQASLLGVSLAGVLSIAACGDSGALGFGVDDASGIPEVGDKREAADPKKAAPAQSTWIQLSTDDSTSMASAQMYKAGFSGRALKTHEFVNYYDPPEVLFDAEPWAHREQIDEAIELALEAERQTVDCPAPCESKEVADLLFQMRAERITKVTRRNWNIFLCVDVSGSMEGDKIAFVRYALATMLTHFKTGDRLTLVTFDSIAHDVFLDLEFDANEETIRDAFASLSAGTSTNMLSGLQRVYHLAQSHFDPSMLQRAVLFSDGMANVGETDIGAFANLTRINGQEGIYLSGVGVGRNYDWARMDRLTDAGKGAHVFLPNRQEVELIFGDYFPKMIEVAADNIAIEMNLPAGITLESFSGEEVSTDPNQRLQNIVLAAGDDLTFIARFVIEDTAALGKAVSLKVTLRPLASGEEVVVERDFSAFSDLFTTTGQLLQRTRIVDAFGKWAARDDSEAAKATKISAALTGYGTLDWGLSEIESLLP